MQRNPQRAGGGGIPVVAPACKWTAEGVMNERGIFIRKSRPIWRNLRLRSEGIDEGPSLGPSQPILPKHSSISRRKAYVSCHGYAGIQLSAQKICIFRFFVNQGGTATEKVQSSLMKRRSFHQGLFYCR